MWYFPKLLISILLVFVCICCDNKVEIYTKGNPIPVVYCLLNPGNETQYVRIGKSFSSSSDSLIWSYPYDVYLEKWGNNRPEEVIVFEKSNISERDTGHFPIEGLSIYRADFKPVSGEEYHLFVYFPDIDKIVSGTTIVMSTPKILDPEYIPGRTISFDTISPFILRWSGGSFPGLYQGVFKMNYSETLGNNTKIQTCFFETPVYQKQQAVDVFEENISGKSYLKSVANQIKPVEGISRELLNFEFILYGGGTDLAISVANDLSGSNPFTLGSNTTNISGGFGVFSSLTQQRIINLQPSLTTKYFLATSSYTRNLGFDSTDL